MICQYCGHKLTDRKCLNPACPGRLRGESVSELKCIYWENATPDDFINARRGETLIQGVGEIDTLYAENLVHNFGKAWKEKLTPAPAEVEDLLDHIISAANSVSIPSESNYLNDLKSRLLAAFSNTTPYLSQDVNVPVEKLEQDLEQYITLGSTGCRTIAEDVEFNRLHSKFLAAFRKAGE